MYKGNLFDLIRQEEVVVWAGAGFSLYAGYPSGKDLCQAIFNDLSDDEKVNIDKSLLLPNLAENYYRIKGNNRNSLIRLLKKLFKDKSPKSTEYHDKIAQIPHFKTIITTNYDCLFENSLKGNGQLVLSDSDIPYLQKGKTQIFKAHGDLSSPDSIIITASDYAKFFQVNRSDNLVWTIIKERLSTKNILFLGYGLEDPNVEAIFSKITDSLGANRKECFFVAPDLPQHKVIDLTYKRIHYINSNGEDLIDEIIENLKENIVWDLKKGKVSIDTFNKFLTNFELSPTIKASGESNILVSIDPIGKYFTGKINFIVKNDKEIKKRINDFISGRSIEGLMINSNELIDSKLWIKDILIDKHLKGIEFKSIPREWDINIRFEDGFEFLNIPVQAYGSNSLLIIYLNVKNAKIKFSIKLPIKNNKGFKTTFNFEHNDKCGVINEEIELYNFLYLLSKGEKFTIFHNNKNIYSNKILYLEPLQDEWSYFLQYFKNLKKVERYYNIAFSDLKINESTYNNIGKLNKIISFIEDKYFEEDWNDEISFTVQEILNKKFEEFLKIINTGSVIFFHGENEEKVNLHGHLLNIGYPTLYIINPIIMNLDKFMIDKTIPLIVKSKISKRKIKYNKFPTQKQK